MPCVKVEGLAFRTAWNLLINYNYKKKFDFCEFIAKLMSRLGGGKWIILRYEEIADSMAYRLTCIYKTVYENLCV